MGSGSEIVFGGTKLAGRLSVEAVRESGSFAGFTTPSTHRFGGQTRY
jgi:hypothetical protein